MNHSDARLFRWQQLFINVDTALLQERPPREQDRRGGGNGPTAWIVVNRQALSERAD